MAVIHLDKGIAWVIKNGERVAVDKIHGSLATGCDCRLDCCDQSIVYYDTIERAEVRIPLRDLAILMGIVIPPSPTPTPTVTPTISISPSSTPTPTPTPTISASTSSTPTPTPTVTPSITESVTPTPTPTVTPSSTS